VAYLLSFGSHYTASGRSRKPYDHDVERERLHAICGSHAGASETYPFGPRTAVYKVGGKMFALVPLDPEPPTVSLKCDPEWSEVLRNAYDAVRPGYHLNKRHWNSIVLDGTIGDDEIAELVAHSYELVAPTRRAGARGTEPAA
jgi:predicted DNA-binding protein (MmcQ/YjbR family)